MHYWVVQPDVWGSKNRQKGVLPADWSVLDVRSYYFKIDIHMLAIYEHCDNIAYNPSVIPV